MIVPMKSVTLVCLESERDATLAALRELGALHLTPVMPPAGADVDDARRAIAECESALAILDAAAPAAQPAEGQPPKPADLAGEIHRTAAARKAAEDRLPPLLAEERTAAPLGDFDPSLLANLESRGVWVRFCSVPEEGLPALPEGVRSIPFRGAGGEAFAALVGLAPFDGISPLLAIPARSLTSIRNEIASVRMEIAAARDRLQALHAHRATLTGHLDALRERQDFACARAGMGSAAALAYLRGYCPAPRIGELRAAAQRHGWGLLLTDPDPSEAVPTLIRSPAWVRPIESLFELIKIRPGYREADVSSSFLLFLSLFFAMIVGDAGYGLVFLLLTGALRLKMKKASPNPFRLMYIFSLCTIVWGVLTGAYFGVTQLPALLSRFRIDWLTQNRNVMHLCLVIGAVHLSVAHVWVMIRSLNSLAAVAQAGWTAITWTMFFAARAMLLGIAFPKWYVPIAILGLLAVILFMTPLKKMKSEWINHAMLPLTLMSNFGDILSYLRLFALSVAGLQLAGAFNSMVSTIPLPFYLKGLIAAVILFAGHALNIALSAISVLVHGIRLNALEFSMHFGLEWAGIAYSPFAGRPRPEGAAPPGGSRV
jgi:V/A-type H+/Na+-transporting ATPase subunit I